MNDYIPVFWRHQNATSIENEGGLKVSLDNGLKIVQLNATAKMVWESTATPRNLDDIVEHLHSAYGRDRLTCRDEVLHFLDDATNLGLISHYISSKNAFQE